jgi:hypothetical protein
VADVLDPLPADGPASLAAVKAQLGIADTRSDELLGQLVGVVNALLRGSDSPTVDPTSTTAWPVTRPARGQEDWTAPELASVVSGASMLVARLYQRRNSPLGYEQVGDLSAVYVSRNDPDLAMLLQLGSWRGPQVG